MGRIIDIEAFERAEAVMFPADPIASLGPASHGSWFVNPEEGAAGTPLAEFYIAYRSFASFDAEWPIQVHVPLALKGFRKSLELSQARLASALGQRRVNIERWEGGTSRPFRGHLLPLISMLRPLVNGQLSAGQLLNLLAAIVCPTLTRPTATYRGHEILEPLAERGDDHRDLGPALLEAFVLCEILTRLDDDKEDLDSRYVPLAGVKAVDRATEPWELDVRSVARTMNVEDREVWLAVGRRLGRRPA